MGLVRRLFGPALDEGAPAAPEEREGHVHAPDASPDEVVLPKRRRSSRALLAGKPPTGWRRQASESSGGVWPWSGGDSSGGDGGGGDWGGGGGSGGSGGSV